MGWRVKGPEPERDAGILKGERGKEQDHYQLTPDAYAQHVKLQQIKAIENAETLQWPGHPMIWLEKERRETELSARVTRVKTINRDKLPCFANSDESGSVGE